MAEEFQEAVTRLNPAFRPILSPAFHVECCAPTIATKNADAVFTSPRAVACLGPGDGRMAWCVGDKTARMASEFGFLARSAGGDVDALIEMILSAAPDRDMVHYRGEIVRGELAARLRASGVTATEVVVYRTHELPLSDKARSALGGDMPVLLPLFSPETARIVASSAPFHAPVVVVAMSQAIADQARSLGPVEVRVVPRPTMEEMVAHVAGFIA